MAKDQNSDQNSVFAGIGAKGRAGSGGSNTGPSRGTSFDSTPGAGAAIDISDQFHDVGRVDSVGAASLDTGRTALNDAGVVRLTGDTPTPNQPTPAEYKTGVGDVRQSRDADQ